MSQTFAQKLAVGGKTNSLGLAEAVVQEVLRDKHRLDELYRCLFEPDPWLRMRAADSLEKICRVHPEWLEPFVDRLFDDFGTNEQPSVQWHLAQILAEVQLGPAQQHRAVQWLKDTLQHTPVDWIVAANVMTTLTQFAQQGLLPKEEARQLIKSQEAHHSSSVRKRVIKLLAQLKP